jgi:hypothetical protein
MTTTVSQYSSAQQQALYDMMNGSVTSNEVGGATAAGADGASPDVSLTPEALMVYCQTRLQGIDSQISAAMTQQENINSEQTSIGKLLTEVSNDSAAASGSTGLMNNPAECKLLAQNIETLITQIQQDDPGCSQLGQLELLHDTVVASGSGTYTDPTGLFHGYYNGGNPMGLPGSSTPPPNVNQTADNQFGTNELSNFSATLTTINSSLGGNAELGMIQIQSHMSDRTTAIQLTTSILQSYDDGLSKIADNIGK